MRKWIPALLITFVAAVSIFFIKSEDKAVASVLINEVCSSRTRMAGEEAVAEEYIELYNTTNETICLAGWMISDDKTELDKHVLPEIYIEPQGYVVLFADGAGSDPYAVNFKLSESGETLFLSDPAGELVDQVYFPAIELNQSYARITDSASTWDMFEGTPGRSNDEGAPAAKKTLHNPVFSHESGYYEDEFVLTLEAEAGQNIYYTLDGSVPTKDSFVYVDGISISNRSEQENVINDVVNIVADWNDYYISPEKADKATVVRAVAMDDHNQCSEVITKTFIVGLEQYKDCKILSVVAEPELLIGENGIFITGKEYDDWYLSSSMSGDRVYEQGWTENYFLTNFWQRGSGYEVPAEVFVLEDGKENFSQNVGLRAQGNYTRMLNKKSLQLFAREMYSGSYYFDQKILGDYNSHAVYVSVFPEKAYCMNLAKGRNLGIQQAEPCVLFLNGEYWYTGVLMEKYDATYFAEHYGVNAENVLCMKDCEPSEREEYAYLYHDLFNYLCDGTVSDEEKIKALYDQIDVQSFIDWLCFNLYVCNDDVSYVKNSILWRTINKESGIYGDGKWRWVVYDIDHAAGLISPESSDFREFVIVSENPFYWALRSSPEFCEQMVITAMDMLNTNFSEAYVEETLQEWGRDLDFGNGFFIKRPEYMIESLENEFGLTGTVETVRLLMDEPSAGRIYINTTEAMMSDGAWEGKYFTDYPVTVTAAANEGYRFAGWTGDVQSTEESLEVEVQQGGTTLQAIFVKE